MKLIRQLFRYIRDGFKNIWNNLFMSLSSVITLTLTLSLCALFVLFAYNTRNLQNKSKVKLKFLLNFQRMQQKNKLQQH